MFTPEASRHAWVIIPKFGGALSLIGSTFLLRDIGRKWKDVPLTTEVLAHITIANVFIAFWECFLSTWLVPKDSHAFMASGNTATCEMQGFISVCAFMTLEVSYTILAVLYWIVVARGWTEQKIRHKRTRFFFLGIPLLLAIGFSIALLVMDMYNFTGVYSCFIEEYPFNCDRDEKIECTRGSTATYWQGALFTGVLVCTIVIIIFMGMLVRAIRNQEKKTDRYLSVGQNKRREMTNKSFWQAVRYISVFLISNLPFYIYAVYDTVVAYPPISMVYIYVTIWPCFGVFNSLAYFRPKYLSYRELNKHKSRMECLCTVLHIDIGGCCKKSEDIMPPNINGVLAEEDLSSPLFGDERSIADEHSIASGAGL